MTPHEKIVASIQEIITELDGVEVISPASVAQRVQDRFAGDGLDDCTAYASLEHYKQMSRKALGKSFDKLDEAAGAEQPDLFSGRLQQRYPVQIKPGEQPMYKRLEAMTGQELQFNIDRFFKAGRALTMHGRALQAYQQSRPDTATEPANDTVLAEAAA